MQNQNFKWLPYDDKLIVKQICREKIESGMKHSDAVIAVWEDLKMLPWIPLAIEEIDSITARVRHRVMKCDG